MEGKTTDWIKAHAIFPLTSVSAPCLPVCATPRECEASFWVHAQESPPRHAPGCGGSYADVLMKRPDSAALVGQATVFVSHAYGYLFLDAVDAIASWEARNPRAGGEPHFFYFDLLVVNQHGSTMVVPFDMLRDEFGSGVRAVGHTLFLLSWSKPVSLCRAWCIFEAAVTLECGATFECILPPGDEVAFAAALVHDLGSAAHKLTDVVDARASVAAQDADKANIDALIVNALGGHEKVDKMVVSAMRSWMLTSGAARLARMTPDEACVAPLKRELAFLHWLEGTAAGSALAARVLEEFYSDCLRVRGEADPETAFSACRYGRNLVHRGQFADGEALLRTGLAGLRAARGSGCARSAAWCAEALGWHGYALGRLGRAEEAETIAQESIAVRREVFGVAHKETAGALVDLGVMRMDAGRLQEAQALLEEGVAGYRAFSPSDSNSALLWALREYLRLLELQGRLPEAVALLEGTLLRGHEIRFGEAHATTKRLTASLARIKGKLEGGPSAT